jgi:hypothetical protein
MEMQPSRIQSYAGVLLFDMLCYKLHEPNRCTRINSVAITGLRLMALNQAAIHVLPRGCVKPRQREREIYFANFQMKTLEILFVSGINKD